MKVKRFKKQNYARIKRDLQKRRILFTDPEFPPTSQSLWHHSDPKIEGIEWRRIRTLCDAPRFILDGHFPHESSIIQGSLGDCWLIAAMTAMTAQKRLWEIVVPDSSEQEWDPKRPGAYCGIFHFRFWHFGTWYNVVIDDHLPVRNNRLVFARSRNENEFWCPLLEKAYAKFHGCYEGLISGSLAEALVDITGGVPKNVNISSTISEEEQQGLLKELRNALKTKSLILAAAKGDLEDQKGCGLMKGHAYSVNRIVRVYVNDRNEKEGIGSEKGVHGIVNAILKQRRDIYLVQLRNPWGRKEWTGPWSTESVEWNRIGNFPRRRMLSKKGDGQFWICFNDFVQNFAHITVCYLHLRSIYNEYAFTGHWTLGTGDKSTLRAGGSINEKETFLCNPQYMIEVPRVARIPQKGIIISLLQSHKADKASGQEGAKFSIGVTVIHVEENRRHRLHHLAGFEPVAMTDFTNCRSNFLQVNLPRGRYIIIPSTYKSHQEGDYYLRVYSALPSTVRCLQFNEPKNFCWYPRRKPYEVVTRLRILYGKDFEDPYFEGYYVRVTTEDHSYGSQTVWNTTEPHWNWCILIFRHCTSSPITLHLWATQFPRCGRKEHRLLGKTEIETPVDDKLWQLTVTVKNEQSRPTGTIVFNAISSHDCMYGL